MNNIFIKMPSDLDNKWRTCEIVSAQISHPNNSATVKVKGVSKDTTVNTIIVIDDLRTFISGEEVRSLYGYFKLKMDDKTKDLFKYEI